MIKPINKMNKKEISIEIARLKKAPIVVFSENGVQFSVPQAILEQKIIQRNQYIEKLEMLRDKRKI